LPAIERPVTEVLNKPGRRHQLAKAVNNLCVVFYFERRIADSEIVVMENERDFVADVLLDLVQHLSLVDWMRFKIVDLLTQTTEKVLVIETLGTDVITKTNTHRGNTVQLRFPRRGTYIFKLVHR